MLDQTQSPPMQMDNYVPMSNGRWLGRTQKQGEGTKYFHPTVIPCSGTSSHQDPQFNLWEIKNH